MRLHRSVFAAILSAALIATPLWSAPTPTPSTTALGTIVSAQKAHVGTAEAEVGTTVYGGDRLSTDSSGTVQLRAGAARLLLQNSSAVVVSDDKGAPAARLLAGTATFSTGNAHAFSMLVSQAVITAQTDAPTIGQVTYLSDKELLVRATKGGLVVTVDGESKSIADGSAYRVILDPTEAQGPEGAGGGGSQSSKGMGGPPLRAGRDRFIIVAIAVIAGATAFGIYKALESPDRP
jgi:hypothetical protein